MRTRRASAEIKVTRPSDIAKHHDFPGAPDCAATVSPRPTSSTRSSNGRKGRGARHATMQVQRRRPCHLGEIVTHGSLRAPTRSPDSRRAKRAGGISANGSSSRPTSRRSSMPIEQVRANPQENACAINGARTVDALWEADLQISRHRRRLLRRQERMLQRSALARSCRSAYAIGPMGPNQGMLL